MAKAKIQHVPYRGSPQGITDLLAKRIDFQMDTPTVLLPFIKDGRLRAIGVTGPKRFFAVPDVPTIAEQGVPGYSVTSLARRRRPGGTAGGVRQQGQCGDQGDPGRARGDRAAARLRQRDDADHAGGIQGAGGRGRREMDQGGRGREYSAGLASVRR